MLLLFSEVRTFGQTATEDHNLRLLSPGAGHDALHGLQVSVSNGLTPKSVLLINCSVFCNVRIALCCTFGLLDRKRKHYFVLCQICSLTMCLEPHLFFFF